MILGEDLRAVALRMYRGPVKRSRRVPDGTFRCPRCEYGARNRPAVEAHFREQHA